MSLMANALPTANQPGLAAITTRQQATWASGDFAVVARTIQIRGAVGSPGRVVGLDMTPAMLDRARGHVAEASADYIELREGLMEALPFPDRSFDAVVSNGVLNLSTRKSRALAEMLRVCVRARVALGELVLTGTLPEAITKDPTALAV